MLAALLGVITNVFNKIKFLYGTADADRSEITNDSYLAQIMAVDGTAADFDDNTDSLEAIRNRIDSLIGTPADTDVSTDIANVKTAIDGISSQQTITVTEQEAIVAGEICISTSGGYIPESSLTDIIATQIGIDTGNQVSDADSQFSVDWINDYTFVYVFRDVSSTNDGVAVPVVMSTDRATITIGSNYIYDSGSVRAGLITSINSNRFVIAYLDAGDFKVDFIAGQWNRIPNTLTFGSNATTALGGDSNSIAVTDHDDDAFACVFNDDTNSVMKMIAGTVNSSTLAVTLGSPVQIGTGDNTYMSIDKVETNKVVTAYREAGDANKGYAEICTISTVTITEGAAVLFEVGAVTYTVITVLDSSNCIIGFVDTGDNSILKVIVGEISGATTIAFSGSAANLSEGTDTIGSPSLITIDPTHFKTIWDNTIDSKTRFSISSVSGITITPGNRNVLVTDIPSDNTTYHQCLSINNVNDIIYVGKTTNIYALLFDVLWRDDNFEVYDITGVASDASGTIIVDGIDEGNASGLDKRISTYIDNTTGGIRKKDHSCSISDYRRRVRNLDTDTLKAIGGN